MNGKKIIHIKFLSIFLIAVLLMSVKVRAATYTLQVNKFPQENQTGVGQPVHQWSEII